MTFTLTAKGTFANVTAEVELFGKHVSVDAGDVNPYLPEEAGPAIANAALKMLKTSA